MTNQQSNVLLALTRDYPRTLDALASETGYPKASIRRCIHQLRGTIPHEVFGKVIGIDYMLATGEYRLRYDRIVCGKMGSSSATPSGDNPTA